MQQQQPAPQQYGAPAAPYGASQPHAPAPYGAPQPHAPAPYGAPAHPAVAPHGAPPVRAQGKSSKAIWFAIAGALVVAGAVVAIVMVTRGGSKGGAGSRDDLTKAAIAALAAGDVDALMKLGDPKTLMAEVADCKKTSDDDDRSDPDKQSKKMREQHAEVAARTKGFTIDVVEITDGHNKQIAKGDKLGPGCTAKVAMTARDVDVKVKLKKGDATPVEWTIELEAVEAGGRWYLVDDIDVEVTAGTVGAPTTSPPPLPPTADNYPAMLQRMTELKDRTCACTDKACGLAAAKAFTDWSTEQMKAMPANITPDAETLKKMAAISDAYKACLVRLSGGTWTPPPPGTPTPSGTPPPTGAPPASTFAVGERVMAKWTNGSWYPGKIVAIHADGTIDINYDDGDKSRNLPPSKVRKKSASSGGGKSSSSSSSDAPCPGPGITRRCNGKCVNIQEDDNHCGGCNNRCPAGKHCDGHLFCRDAEGNL